MFFQRKIGQEKSPPREKAVPLLNQMSRLSRDQKRQKKVGERRERLAARQNPVLSANKEQIAEAVHRAVCQYAGSDGFGFCRWYAICGWLLLQDIGYKNVVLQAGRLALQPDPDKPTRWIEMDPSHGVAGEFHCWLVLPDQIMSAGSRPMGRNVQVIDFAARQYRSYVERLSMIDGDPPRWRWVSSPDFIWHSFDELPPWLLVSAQEKTANAIYRSLSVTRIAWKLSICD